MQTSVLTILVRFLAFGLGTWLVFRAMLSVVRTFVLPRGTADPLTRAVFLALRAVFELRMRKVKTYEQRDQVRALNAPIGVLALLPAWLALALIGYPGMLSLTDED